MPALAACVSENAQRDKKGKHSSRALPRALENTGISSAATVSGSWAAGPGGPGQLTVGARLLAPVVAGRGSSAGRKLFDAVLPHAPQKGCLGPLVVTRAAQLTDSTSPVRRPAPSVDALAVRRRCSTPVVPHASQARCLGPVSDGINTVRPAHSRRDGPVHRWTDKSKAPDPVLRADPPKHQW